MKEAQALGIFDRLLYVKNGPVSNFDSTPATVELALTNGSTHITLVLTSETAKKLAQKLAVYTRT